MNGSQINYLEFFKNVTIEELRNIPKENDNFFINVFDICVKKKLINECIFNQMIMDLSSDKGSIENLEYLLGKSQWKIYKSNEALLTRNTKKLELMIKSNKFDLENYVYLTEFLMNLLRDLSFDLIKYVLSNNKISLKENVKMKILNDVRINHKRLLLTKRLAGGFKHERLMKELNELEDFLLNSEDFFCIIQKEKIKNSDYYDFYKEKIDNKIMTNKIKGFH